MGSGFEIKDNVLVLRVNPKVYPIERIYATAYVFLDKYYFIFDGDKDKEVILKVRPKSGRANLEKFGDEFFEEMLSITNYFKQYDQNKDVIKLILQRALFSLVPEKPSDDLEKEFGKLQKEIENITD